MSLNTLWHGSNDDNELLKKIVGPRAFGERPIDRLDEVLAFKARTANMIAKLLEVTPQDTVLDIGAGGGLVAARMADLAKQVVCVDISPEQKAFAERLALRDIDNVTYHVMEYADFSQIADLGIKHAFSTAVFIHFSPYDIAAYLRALAEIIPVGGRFWFSFVDGDQINPEEHKTFQQHLAIHTSRGDPRYLICPQSPAFIRKLATMYGWSVLTTRPLGTANMIMVVERQ
nr:methyltransferase domain-containing protein [uncultured Hyphomonas sp.]